jgi:hypothetical protein
MIKQTNLDIKDAAFLHIVHILQHPTSHPTTTTSTQSTMVNVPEENFYHFHWASMAIQQSGLHNNLIKRMPAKAGVNQKEPEPLVHC